MTSYYDKGFKSRKMIMAYVAMALITLGFLAIGVWPAMHVAYAEFCIGVLSATTIFTGMDTATKLIGARFSNAAQPAKVAPRPVEEA